MRIGEKFKIPAELCGHTGRVVWVSSDGKTIGVKCNEEHSKDPITKEPYKADIKFEGGEYTHKPSKKSVVYVIDLRSLDNP